MGPDSRAIQGRKGKKAGLNEKTRVESGAKKGEKSKKIPLLIRQKSKISFFSPLFLFPPSSPKVGKDCS